MSKVQYIEKRNPVAAIRTVRRIKAMVNGLIIDPNRGRAGRIFGTRELVITNTSYIAAFRIRGDEIQILKIVHHARNWEEAMKDAD